MNILTPAMMMMMKIILIQFENWYFALILYLLLRIILIIHLSLSFSLLVYRIRCFDAISIHFITNLNSNWLHFNSFAAILFEHPFFLGPLPVGSSSSASVHSAHLLLVCPENFRKRHLITLLNYLVGLMAHCRCINSSNVHCEMLPFNKVAIICGQSLSQCINVQCIDSQ